MFKIIFSMANGERYSVSRFNGHPLRDETDVNCARNDIINGYDTFVADDGTEIVLKHMVSTKIERF